jgi:hypothetical protein
MRIVLTRNGAKIIKELEIEDVPKRRNRTIDSINISSSIIEESNPFQNLNKNHSNYTEISLKERKLKIPFEIEEKYNKSNTNNSNDSNKQVIPDILYDINKSMQLDSKNNSSNSKLPIIRNAYPIKYIINPLSYKKLEKDVKIKEESLKTRNKELNENCFRSQVFEDPKKIFDKNSSKEIFAENRNLIMYLNSDDTISNKYMEKLYKYNEERIKKLNKICQSAFYYRDQGAVIEKFIKQKLKSDAVQTSEYYKEKLEEMKNNLEKSKDYIREFPQFNKRERYAAQIKQAELDWVKYDTARLYKKSNPPITNLYIENNDDD